MLEQKQMLVDSMGKLITHLSSNKLHQIEIYRDLSRQDIQKIISNFEDPNPIIRKTSARLLCELLYNNAEVKGLFMDDMCIEPAIGNIVLNKIPHSNKVEEALLLVKATKINSSNCFCWYVLLDKCRFEILRKEDHFDVDPIRCIFGITFEKNPSYEPFCFSEVSDRRNAETSKYVVRDNVTTNRNRVESSQFYSYGHNRDTLMGVPLQSDHESSFRNNSMREPLESYLQRDGPTHLSTKTPVIVQVKTSNHCEQRQITFQDKIVPGFYVPKTTRVAPLSETGAIKTNRDLRPVKGEMPSMSYLKTLKNMTQR